jgi:hypothetical protein
MPFTVDQFLTVFADYNTAVWPIQIFLVALALLAVYLTTKSRQRAHQFIALILAFFWIWIGVVYHLIYFTTINTAAYAFGILNIVQGLVFLYYGLVTSSLVFRFRLDFYGLTGVVMVFYALLIYPILGHALGRTYPRAPTFGLPCPTTIFTFGILLWADKRVPIPVLIIPFVWSLVGFTAALNLGIKEDTGLLIAGLVATSCIVARNRAEKNRTVHHAV